MVEFHAGMFSLKDARTLLEDMHWNAKKFGRQAAVSHSVSRDVKNAANELMNKNTKAERKAELQKKELPHLLDRLEQFSILKEQTGLLFAKEGAEVQKKTLKEMKKHIREEIAKLVNPDSPSIPRSVAATLLRDVRKHIQKHFEKNINNQAQISLEVQRGSASATLQTIKIRAPSERTAARRLRRLTYKAELQLDVIKAMRGRLEKDESIHFISNIQKDFVGLVKDYYREFRYIYLNLLYCLLFMSFIEKKFEDLEDVMKKGKRHPDVAPFIQQVEKRIKKMKSEWYTYMKSITKVLQQLRFSVAPAQEGQVLAKAA